MEGEVGWHVEVGDHEQPADGEGDVAGEIEIPDDDLGAVGDFEGDVDRLVRVGDREQLVEAEVGVPEDAEGEIEESPNAEKAQQVNSANSPRIVLQDEHVDGAGGDQACK